MSADVNSLVHKPLIGVEEATIDEKGRVLVSKKKRDRLGDPFVMAIGLKGCIEALPIETWNQVLSEIAQAPALNPGRQAYAAMYMGTAEDDLHFDGQGRVVVPFRLRDMGQLTERVVLEGAFDRVRIWSKPEYEKYLEDMDNYGADRETKMLRAYTRMTGTEF